MRILLAIGAGGFLGAIARYLMQLITVKWLPLAFPYGTLIVNVVGCFLIGIFYGLADRGNMQSPEWKFFLTTGFCGGFTTFSTFSYEVYTLWKLDHPFYFSLYIGLSLTLSILATFLAIYLVRSV